jgi:hypothetical protein
MTFTTKLRGIAALCALLALVAAGCSSDGNDTDQTPTSTGDDKADSERPRRPGTDPVDPVDPVDPTEPSCIFDEHLSAVKEQTDLTVGPTITVAGPGDLSVARQLQFVIGLDWYDVNTFAEALEQTDDREIYVTPLTAPDGRAYVLYRYWAGDNPHGFIFEDAEQPVVLFCDDFVCTCEIEIEDKCIFGEEGLHDVLALASLGQKIRYSNDNFDSMPALRQQQLLRGMEQQQDEEIATPREAFEMADYGPSSPDVSTQDMTLENGLGFVYFDLTLGENGYGFIFADGTKPAASYGDGYRDECSAPSLTAESPATPSP